MYAFGRGLTWISKQKNYSVAWFSFMIKLLLYTYFNILVYSITRILYINGGLFRRYLDTNSIGKIFIDGITDKYCSLKNLLFVIFILSVIILVIYINIDDFINRKIHEKKLLVSFYR